MKRITRRSVAALLSIGALVIAGLLIPSVQAAPSIDVSNFHMSDRPDGPAMTDFSDHLNAVYVIFDYANAQSEDVRVVVYPPSGPPPLLEDTQTYNGSGTTVLEILAPNGGFDRSNPAHPTSTYVTTILVRTFFEWNPVESIEWTVTSKAYLPAALKAWSNGPRP